MQVLRLSTPAFSFLATAGPELLLGGGSHGPIVYAGFAGTFAIVFGSVGANYCAVNLFPIFALYIIRPSANANWNSS